MFHQLCLLLILFGMVVENKSLQNESSVNIKRFETKRYLVSLLKNDKLNPDLNKNEKENGIYKPEFHAVFNALYDLILYWGCKPMTVIFETNNGFTQRNIFEFFKQRQPICQPTILKVEFSKTFCPVLTQFRYFVYIGNQHLRNFFISTTNCTDLFTSMRTWIVISDFRQIHHFHSSDLHPFVNTTWSQITFLVPQLPSTNRSSFHSMFVEYGMASRVDIYDVFYSFSTLQTEVISIAYWTTNLRLYFYHRVEDDQWLRGRTVRLLTVQNTCPMVCIGGQNNTQLLPSYAVDLFTSLAKLLHANQTYTILEDSAWGVSNSNYTFSGFLGQLQRGEFDASMVITSVTEERKVHAVRYSEAGIYGNMQIAIKQPLPLIPPTIYLLPFQVSVWITCTGSLTLIIILILIRNRFYQIKNTQMENYDIIQKSHRKREIKLDFFDQAEVNGLATKVIFLTLYISVFLLFTYYTSILTSVFAYQDVTLPFQSMEELAARDDYTILTIKDTIYQLAFENAKDGPYKKIWEKISRNKMKSLVPHFTSPFNLVAKNEKYAYFTNGFIFQKWVKRSCDLTYIPEKYLQQSFNMPFRKDFPYYKVYSSSMWKLLEAGVYSRLKNLHISSDYDKCEDLGVSQTLELNQIYLLFLFLLGSFVVSFMALLIEIILYSYKHNRMHICY